MHLFYTTFRFFIYFCTPIPLLVNCDSHPSGCYVLIIRGTYINTIVMNIPFLFIGTTEIVVILLVVLLFFGGKKIPELMNGIGKGVKSFKDGMNGKDVANNQNENQNEKVNENQKVNENENQNEKK